MAMDQEAIRLRFAALVDAGRAGVEGLLDKEVVLTTQDYTDYAMPKPGTARTHRGLLKGIGTSMVYLSKRNGIHTIYLWQIVAAKAATGTATAEKENSDMAKKNNGTAPATDAAADTTADTTPATDTPPAPFTLPPLGSRVTLQVQEYLRDNGGLRRCAGIKKIGHEQHDAPISEFGKYAAGPLGLDTVCRASWREYTKRLRDATLATAPSGAVAAPTRRRGRKAPATAAPAASVADTAAQAAPAPKPGTKAAAAAATREQVRREARDKRQAAAAARQARKAQAAAPAPAAPAEEPAAAAATE